MLNLHRAGLTILVASLLPGPVFGQTAIPRVIESGSAQRASASAPGIFGCAAPGSKQIIGAGGAGVVGGLIGNRVASGNRTLGTVIGGAVGAAAGSWIGCKLQIADQRKAEAAAARAAAKGQSQHWMSADTGVSGSAVPLASSQLANLNFPESVVPSERYDNRAGIYVAAGRTNLRALPDVGSTLVGTLDPGERVTVAAGVENSPWLLVSENGLVRGYVSAPLLREQGPLVGSGCRIIRQTITKPGEGSAMQDFTACPDNNGGWSLTGV